jgi:protein TonB
LKGERSGLSIIARAGTRPIAPDSSMDTNPTGQPGYDPPRRPRWGTLALVVVLHGLALLVLIQAFAPKFTAATRQEIIALFDRTVAITVPAEPEGGAAGEEGPEAVPQEASAPPVKLPARPTDLPPASSTGSETQSGANESGEGTGAGGEGAGTGSGMGGTGQGGGIATRPAVRSGNLDQARDFPVPPGGRQARFGKSVTVAFTVTADGRARDCTVARSEVDAETAARVCPLVIEKIRFNPARRADGAPVETRYGYRVDFRASD